MVSFHFKMVMSESLAYCWLYTWGWRMLHFEYTDYFSHYFFPSEHFTYEASP